MDDTTDTPPPGEPSYTVPTRPDGWPDLLGRRPPSSSDRARLGISGTDAADRIAALRSALASLAAKHDWTLTDDPPT